MKKVVIICIAAIGISLGAAAFVTKKTAQRVSANASQSGIFTGYVTDLKCKRSIDKQCNRECFGRGEQPAILLDGSYEVVRLKNAEEVKNYPGTHVEINGTRFEDVIVVSAVKAL